MFNKKFMFCWLVAGASLFGTVNINAANILENGTFDNGLASWEPPGWWTGGDGNFAVDERGRFCTTVTALGTNDWGAQLRQSNLTFIAGENYDVSLRVWSSVPVSLPMSATDESDGFVWLFGNNINIDSPLEGEGQVINMSFSSAADTESGTFRFLMGGGTVPIDETVCFDDIVVDAPAPNLIENSTFDNGYEPWIVAEFGSTAQANADDGRLCVLAEDPGPDPWSLQVRADGLQFIESASYVFSADMWSSAPVNLQVSGVDESNGFVWHFGQDVAIDAPVGGDPQQVEVTFVNGAGTTENGRFRFLMGDGHVTPGTTVCMDNVKLVDPSGSEAPEEPAPAAVYVNSYGYMSSLSKIATFTPAEDSEDKTTARTWTLYNGESPVASGMSSYHGLDEGSGDHVHRIDFSGVRTEMDNYTLVVSEGELSHSSEPFAIGSDLYEPLKYDALAYFYHNRSATPILAELVGQTWARPAGHLDDDAVQTFFCTIDPADPACRTMNSIGGWYDAGDHGKYVVNGGISVWTLLNQYERAQALGSDMSEFADGAMALPLTETTNGVPDLLDEVRYELEWFLTMQVPAPYPMAGMVHHKMHNEYWTGLPLAPHEDTVTRYVQPPSTAATLNFAAVMAQCHRIYKAFDSAFASTCLNASKVAYAAAKANDFIPATNNGNGGGTYGDDFVEDEFYWAASELYLSTGEAAFAQDMQASDRHLTLEAVRYGQSIMSWGSTQALGLISLATVGPLYNAEESWVQQARKVLVSVADFYESNTATQGYALPMQTDNMYWGSNSNVTNDMIVLGLAHDFTCDERYLETMHTNMHYLMGHNPLGISYISGYGEKDMKNPHHRFWANVPASGYPAPPPGVIAGGPNSQLQDPIAQAELQGCDPLKCYIDDRESYSTNEVTINWNAPLAWAAAYLDQWGDAELQAAAAARCELRNKHFSSFEDGERSWSKRGPAEIATVEGGTRGSYALEVNGCGYTFMDSPAFSTNEFEILGDRIAIDMLLPNLQDDIHWFGQLTFHLTLPSANMHNEWIGSVELTGQPLGSWFTTGVELPAATKAALAGEHDGFITVALNTNNCSAPLMFDNLRFVGNTRGR
ncbi:glycoside hydrolase family 9 protein [Agarilytica rhodophyticola]|uniref:glycoside hydrolase family 9 protein n=1 Tax=Agarilytica rhodophyticola TaxID=1737490 RepID=UPI000B344905|nr:glycoside hydrolase family 9 protein [Agarilytica rhodophyticola]